MEHSWRNGKTDTTPTRQNPWKQVEDAAADLLPESETCTACLDMIEVLCKKPALHRV